VAVVALNALCVVLVLVDIAARSWRIGVVFAAMEFRLRLLDCVALTMLGDAAAALTPWRAGGEPARAFGATRAGVTPAATIVALGLESAVTYIVLFAAGIALALAFGASWADAVRHGARFLTRPWALAGVVVLVAVAVMLFHRLPAHIVERVTSAAVEALRQARAAPASEIVTLVLLSLVSIAARVAILPVVAASFGEFPPLGGITLASFGLLNGQVLTPTPSGAGAVELAAAAGAFGTKEHTGAILAAWRVYTTLIPILLGVAAGAIHYGYRAVLGVFRRT
jgi:uncharacterized membrane protein YbhN (UPF0104 family)